MSWLLALSVGVASCGVTGGVAPQSCVFGTDWNLLDSFQLVDGADTNVINDMIITDSGTMYSVGYSKDGSGILVWITRKSTDSGQTWTTIDSFQETTTKDSQAFSIAIDAEGTLMVLGASRDGADVDYFTVRRSANEGSSWTTTEQFQFNNVGLGRKIVSNSEDNAIGVGYVAGSGGRRLWMSRITEDGGFDWLVKDGFTLTTSDDSEALDVAYDSNGNVYVSGFAGDGTDVHGMLRKSTDNAESWETVLNYQYVDGQDSKISGVATGLNNEVYIGVQANDGTATRWVVRKSTDGGATFETVHDYQRTAGQAATLNALAVDEFGNVFASGSSSDGTSTYWQTFESRDEGTTWALVDEYQLASAQNASAQSSISFDSNYQVYVTGAGNQSATSQFGIIRQLLCEF